MTHDVGGWRDYPICPACLVGAHYGCDGAAYWCECLCGLLPESENRA